MGQWDKEMAGRMTLKKGPRSLERKSFAFAKQFRTAPIITELSANWPVAGRVSVLTIEKLMNPFPKRTFGTVSAAALKRPRRRCFSFAWPQPLSRHWPRRRGYSTGKQKSLF